MKNYEKVQMMTTDKRVNFEGGAGYSASFQAQLIELFSLGLLNGNFYQTTEDVVKNTKKIFEKALVECPEFATKCAIYGNNVNSLKLVPTIWLVYLSTLEDKSLFTLAFPRIIKNPKMLHDFMEIARKGGIRKGMGRRVKKVINEWLFNNLNEYQVTRNKGKLLEVIRTSRPKYSDSKFNKYMAYLSKNELSIERAIALKSVISQLQSGILEEDTLLLIEKHKLQLEELKHSTGSLSSEQSKRLYFQIYKNLNYAALILNLVALERVFSIKVQNDSAFRDNQQFSQKRVIETNIPNELIDLVVSKIKDIDMYRKSNMLPFALISARTMVVTPEFKNAISEMIKVVSSQAFQIKEDIKLMVGIDTSFSMTSSATSSLSCLDVATLFGAMIKKSHTNSKIYAVASKMREVELKAQTDVFEMASEIEKTDVGCGTQFEQIMKNYNNEKYVILITDSEQSDDLEKVWLKKGKKEGAKLIVWQLSPYYTEISKDPSVVYLRGYSDRMLSVIRNIIENKGTQLEEINEIKL